MARSKGKRRGNLFRRRSRDDGYGALFVFEEMMRKAKEYGIINEGNEYESKERKGPS